MKDYYKILEIHSEATIDEIKRSYRQLALKYHPDRNNGDKRYEEIFKYITEAYTILIDIDKRKRYDSERLKESGNRDTSQESEKITPITFLKIFNDIKNKVLQAQPGNINSFALFSSINEILSNQHIDFLMQVATPEVNKMIIGEILICASFINDSSYEIIKPKLLTLANRDENLIDTIRKFKQKIPTENIVRQPIKQKSSGGFTPIFFILCAIFIIFIFSKNINKTISDEEVNNTQNSSLNYSSNNQIQEKDSLNNNNIEKLNQENTIDNQKDKWLDEGWKERNIKNGQMSSCYNFRPYNGKIDNKLEVHVGGGTDVVIKVMNLETNICVRYVYINSGTTYLINNIPEGMYYLKIAYGKNWYSKSDNNQCKGKFFHNPLYEKGTDIMDFNIKYHGDSYSVPSYQLQLDVISNENVSTFSSQNISEIEFND